MQLCSTILKVLAVQLRDAASTCQMPPAYHHRDALTSCSLSAGCTLQVAGGRRATLVYLYLIHVAQQNSAAPQQHAGKQQHVPSTRVYAVVVVAVWEQVGLNRNLDSSV